MAKKKTNPVQRTFDSLGSVQSMPDGYYSGDQPNLNLRQFVEGHFSDSTDPHLLPSAELQAEVETHRNSRFFSLHKYWSKKGHEAIQHYILHFTRPGDLILDPFCGSGGLAAIASQMGRHAIAIDLSPAATLITAGYCTRADPEEIFEALGQIRECVSGVATEAYATICEECGKQAEIQYIDYSAVFQCLKCMNWTPYALWRDGPKRVFRGRDAPTLLCPHCNEPINTQRCQRRGFEPYYERYLCVTCRGQKERGYIDGRWVERDRLTYDASRSTDILSRWARYAPTTALDGIVEPRLVKNVAKAGVTTVADLYDLKAAAVLSAIRHAIESADVPKRAKLHLKLALSGILWTTSIQNRVGQAAVLEATYYVPHNSHRINAWKSFEKKVELVAKANRERPVSTGQVIISTQSATDLSDIPSSSIDYIFTDPPYGSKFQYGQLNLVWEAWLGLSRSWYEHELVVAEHRKKNWDDWAKIFKQSIDEMYRVLKPGRHLTLCYHDTDTSTWALVQDLIAESGFVPVDDRILAIDGYQKTYNQSTGESVTKRDLVLNFRKPEPQPFTMSDQDQEDANKLPKGDDLAIATFIEVGQQIIRDFLIRHPGATKDRVYDELVSRLVASRTMEAHDFDALLRSVAEEVLQPVRKDLFNNKDPDLFGSHVQSRWYLKETADQVDQAEQAKEHAAAIRLEKFIADYLKKRRELEGVHYSDLFEQYLPVQDKPRRLLADWLPEYFIKTQTGTWRLPDKIESEQLTKLRDAGTLRRMKRFANALIDGVPVRDKDRPGSDMNLLDWLRQCRRAGLYEQGRAIYEKGGLNLAKISEEQQIEAEDDYRICLRRGSEEEAKPRSKRRKKQVDDE